MEAVECITVMKVGPRGTEGLILYSNSKKNLFYHCSWTTTKAEDKT